MPPRKNATAPDPAPRVKQPALIVIEEIEAKLKPLGDLHRHDTAWVKAKLAEAKAKL
ncbi:hypothetical protein LQ772_06750 [Frateuria edaphi]|uniref:hypothetical protein n=1 Tax=Frateuria edaphi TaxID=2898793 RepID=UPI001E620799|nr:hypothetical protein [Frateuria edaphi]UGB46984.1 hypothetical protein LQ772_06750 [Frateuria edaphi]